MKSLALHSLATLFIVAAALFAYHRFAASAPVVIGVVDVATVYRLKEAEFTQMVTQGLDEKERQRAMRMASDFARRLPIALDELARDCGCLVLVKSGVAATSPATIDLTELLKKKVANP